MKKIDVSFLNSLDDLIKAGEINQVRTLLEKIIASRVPRPLRAHLAKITLRVGQPQLGFALLRPLVQAKIRPQPPVSVDEKLQYGMCLKQLGMTDHALKIFKEIDGKNHPQVWMYEAVTLFSQWRYSEATQKLQSYCAISTLTDYEKMVGEINLASALFFESHYDEAVKILRSVCARAKAQNLNLLYGNAMELITGSHVLQRQFKEARESLTEAEKFAQNSAPLYQIYIAKWSAVLNVLETQNSTDSLRQLDRVRQKAIELKHWESVRDCDFYFSTCKGDEYLFTRLYFGTPFEEYRKRLIKHFPKKVRLPDYFDWRGMQKELPKNSDGILDLTQKSIGKSKNILKENHRIFRLLKLLSSDFYAPLKPVSLYLSLYPEEKIDPNSALQKVFTLVSQTKKWLKASQIPVEINTTEAGYQLYWTTPFVIRSPRELKFSEDPLRSVKNLIQHFGTKSFTSQQAASLLVCSQRNAVRLLKVAVGENILEIKGQGSKTTYRFVLT